jgi:hypothetical protein
MSVPPKGDLREWRLWPYSCPLSTAFAWARSLSPVWLGSTSRTVMFTCGRRNASDVQSQLLDTGCKQIHMLYNEVYWFRAKEPEYEPWNGPSFQARISCGLFGRCERQQQQLPYLYSVHVHVVYFKDAKTLREEFCGDGNGPLGFIIGSLQMYAWRVIALYSWFHFCQTKYWKNTAHSNINGVFF